MIKTIYSLQYQIFIRKLKQARLEIKLKQDEVAKIIGQTQSYISKMESGQIRLDVIQTLELAKIYKKDITYFLSMD